MTIDVVRFRAVAGRSAFDGLEERVDAARQEQASDQPDDRGEEADDERLERDRGQHLTPRRADRPQRRKLPDALRDGDRQRVEDDERADEESDSREREQEVADVLRELDLLQVLASLLRRGERLRVRRQQRLEVRDELLRRDPRRGGNPDRVELAFAVEELLRRREREDREGGGAERFLVAVARDPREPEAPHRAQARDLDHVADLVAHFVRGPGVDRDLVLRARPAAAGQPQWVEPRLGEVDAEAERRSTHRCRRPCPPCPGSSRRSRRRRDPSRRPRSAAAGPPEAGRRESTASHSPRPRTRPPACR